MNNRYTQWSLHASQSIRSISTTFVSSIRAYSPEDCSNTFLASLDASPCLTQCLQHYDRMTRLTVINRHLCRALQSIAGAGHRSPRNFSSPLVARASEPTMSNYHRSNDYCDEQPVHRMIFILPSIHPINRCNVIGVLSRVIVICPPKSSFELYPTLSDALFVFWHDIFNFNVSLSSN